jgi:hypothetical protein
MLKQSEPTVNISATVPLSLFQRIVEVATELKISKSRVVKEFINLGLDSYLKNEAEQIEK